MAKEAGYRPLFDRLVDLEPGNSELERPPRRTLDREGLRESVRRELERLLATRSTRRASDFEARPLSVLDYGIPDFIHLSAQNPEERRRLEELIAISVSAFEPRLRAVKVEVAPREGERDSLRARIAAELQVGDVWEPILFPTLVSRGGAKVGEGI